MEQPSHPSGYVESTSRRELIARAIITLLVITASTLNASLIYDDLYLLEYFKKFTATLPALKTLFTNLDLAPQEYRLYGLSRVIHFALSKLFGTAPSLYGAIIGVTHILSAYIILQILRRHDVDRIQSNAIAFSFTFSPFIVTSCFHHYSYLILPYQLTLAGVYLIDRSLAAPQFSWSSRAIPWRQIGILLISLAIAWTGEAHLPASILLLAVATTYPSTTVSATRRAKHLALTISAILLGVAIHRSVWIHLAPEDLVGNHRYSFAMPTIDAWNNRMLLLAKSLYQGLADQISAVISFSGILPSAIVAFLCITITFITTRPSRGSPRPDPTSFRPKSRLRLPFLFLFITAASLVIYVMLSGLTGQVSSTFPRRYGYITYTLLLMLGSSVLFTQTARGTLRENIGISYCGGIAGIWFLLSGYCLPAIRSEDRRQWDAIAMTALSNKSSALLFDIPRNNASLPDFNLEVETPILRDGGRFPPIFESNLSGYWWASQYAKLKIGLNFVGYRYELADRDLIRLFGNGIYDSEFKDIPKRSIVVVSDRSLHPPTLTSGFAGVRIFQNFDAYEREILHANPLTEEVVPFTKDNSASIIGLGFTAERRSDISIFPDRHFGTEPRTTHPLLIDYGLAEGEDRVFAPSEPVALPYLTPNRHGAFTYRLEFKTVDEKIVYLDFFDRWTTQAGIRPIHIYLFMEGVWRDAGIIDPAAIAPLAPFSYRFVSRGKTLQIRLQPGPEARDIPFLNGIRIRERDRTILR